MLENISTIYYIPYSIFVEILPISNKNGVNLQNSANLGTLSGSSDDRVLRNAYSTYPWMKNHSLQENIIHVCNHGPENHPDTGMKHRNPLGEDAPSKFAV